MERSGKAECCGEACYYESDGTGACWGEVTVVDEDGADSDWIHACEGHADRCFGLPYIPEPT